MATNWIKMECVPLPTANYPELLVYWNPDSGQLLGDQVDLLHDLVSQAMNQGINGAELSAKNKLIIRVKAMPCQEANLLEYGT